MRIAIAAAVVCTSASWAGNCQDPACPQHILAITNSGGSSLGAYEGGYDYYLTEWLKANRCNNFDAKILTGTSAGSINAFLTFIALADSNHVTCPESSIFYKSWTDIGFYRIRGPETRLGFLDRRGLESIAKSYAPAQMNMANHDYNMILGITATRLKALEQGVAKGLEVPTVKQRFVVRGTFDTAEPKDHGWSCRNYIDWSATTEVPVLPLKQKDTIGAYWPVLYDLALASTGIPGLFKPLPLRHLQIVPWELRDSLKKTVANDTDVYGTLLKEKKMLPLSRGISADTLWSYVDGGLLDNSPIRLAFQIAQSSIDERNDISEEPKGIQYRTDAVKRNVYYLYISPGSSIFPSLDIESATDPASIFWVLGGGLTDWVRSATSNELFTLKEEFRDVERFLLVSPNNYPTFSGLLQQLFGFLEKDVRIFDFYLGMYDAQKYLSGEVRLRFPGCGICEPDITSEGLNTLKAVMDHCRDTSPKNDASSKFQGAMDTCQCASKSCHDAEAKCGKVLAKCKDVAAKCQDAAARCFDTASLPNVKRLAVLSRELYFRFWDTPEGKTKKRALARGFAAAYWKKPASLRDAIRKSLVDNYKVPDPVFEEFSACVDSLAKGRGAKSALLDKIFGCIQEFHDSLASSERHSPASSQTGQCPVSSGLTLVRGIFGDTSPSLEHYLEAAYTHKSDTNEIIVKRIDAILNSIPDSSEFDMVLDCLFLMRFKYKDIPLLDKEWKFNDSAGKWLPHGGPVEPECLTRIEVEAKIQSALFNMLRDYSNVPGGPELERNVVNVFGNPALGYVGKRQPRVIYHASIATPAGGEIGMSFQPDSSNRFRWTIAANIDSFNLAEVYPQGQGLGLSYSVPWYLLLGFEVELFCNPLIQCRLGFKTGPNSTEFWDGLVNLSRGPIYQDVNGPAFRDLNYKLQAEFAVSLMQRLRISIALATRARTWQNFLNGVTPSVSLGCEGFSW